MSWKSALVGSALALSAQTTLANKPLPCPTTGPLQDTASVVQDGTRQKIENRLRAIDSEKRHQVVVITVKSLEEYGYGSIEEMANALGNGCKVGYRGENTGVVILYSQKPSKIKIETAETERYIRDAEGGRIILEAKKQCQKDISCGLDYITGEIDKLIRKEFPDQQSVAKIDAGVVAHDEEKRRQETSELLGSLSIGGVIIVVIGGGGFGVYRGVGAINRRNRRKVLKREILELFTHFQVEKQKYPSWFQDKYIRRSEDIMRELTKYSDEQLDRILSYERMRQQLDAKPSLVKSSIDNWKTEFSTIQSRLEAETDQFNIKKGQISKQNVQLLSDGFLFPSVKIPSIEAGSNPADSLSRIERGLRSLSEIETSLSEIPRFYTSAKGFDTQLKAGLRSLQTENTSLSSQYQSIFGKESSLNLEGIIQGVNELVTTFQDAYKKKDIEAIRSITTRGDSMLNPLRETNRTMRDRINWYGSIPHEITRREKQLGSIKPNPQYSRDASAYAQKTGKRGFLNFDLTQTLGTLQGMLGMIKKLHSQKQGLEKLDQELSNFDREYSKVQEYIGLGMALAAIIAEEIRRQQEAEAKKIAEEKRKQREAEEEEDARRKRDDESSRNTYSPSPSPSPDWNSGGGGGFDGGGASNDW